LYKKAQAENHEIEKKHQKAPEIPKSPESKQKPDEKLTKYGTVLRVMDLAWCL
jgi:hypothetical protein